MEVTPLTGAKLAEYTDVMPLDRFNNTGNKLALKFSRHLTDRDRLALAAGKVNAADVTTKFKIKDVNLVDPGQESGFVSLQMSSRRMTKTISTLLWQSLLGVPAVILLCAFSPPNSDSNHGTLCANSLESAVHRRITDCVSKML